MARAEPQTLQCDDRRLSPRLLPNLAARAPAHGFPAGVQTTMFGDEDNNRHPEAQPRRLDLLNRYDRTPPMAGEAEIRYLDGDFRIVRPGAFVRCAVTGVPIPLEELKYWSVDRQEAYASPDAVLRRMHPEHAQ